jgi:hypothetical protein
MAGLFNSPSPKPAPLPTAPPRMPDKEDPQQREAQRKARIDALNRAGRESTILTSPSDRGGGGDYSRKTLGGQ